MLLSMLQGMCFINTFYLGYDDDDNDSFSTVAQLVSVSASDTNSKVRSSNPAGNKKSFSIG